MAKKSEQTGVEKTKQMKIFLNNREHAVVVMAANLQGKSLGEYMKSVVIAQAKKDAREMSRIIDEI